MRAEGQDHAARFAAIARAAEARRFLVLVSTKAGQMRMGLAQELKRKAEAHGRSAEIVLLRNSIPTACCPIGPTPMCLRHAPASPSMIT